MASRLSTKLIIDREALREIAAERLGDSKVLLENGRFAAAIYLAGYAVECHLKVAICVTLKMNEALCNIRHT